MEYDGSNSCFYDGFRRSIPCSNIYFLQISARVSLKVATNGSCKVKKKIENLSFLFLGYYSKAKEEELEQGSFCFSEYFETCLPCYASYYVEVCLPFSLRVATKCHFICDKIKKINHF